MVDLPEIPKRFVTVDQISDRVTPGAVAAPYAMWANALDKFADITDTLGAEQGQKAGENAPVTIGPDGKPNVQPYPSWGFGSYGRAYNKAAYSGFGAAAANQYVVDVAGLRASSGGDPQKFDADFAAYKDRTLAGIPQDSAARHIAQVQLDHLGSGNMADMVAEKSKVDLSNSKDSIAALISRRSDDASLLARQGGVDSPEFHAAAADLKAAYGQLAGNPLFGEPKAKTDLAYDRSVAQFQGDALLGQAERSMQAGDYQGALKLADEVDKIPNLSDSQRVTLSGGIRRFARETQSQIVAQRTGIRQEADAAMKGIDLKQVDPNSLQVQDIIDRARVLGDFKTVTTLGAKRDSQAIIDSVMGLPPGERAAAARERFDALKAGQTAAPDGGTPAAPAQAIDIPAQYPLFSKTQATATVPGMATSGNIDLTTRPIVHNSDGSISTVRTISYQNKEGKEVLIPTVSNEGTIMSNREAIKYWGEKGQNFGAFNSVEAADAYAKILHEQLYDPSHKPIGGDLTKPYAQARKISNWDELYGPKPNAAAAGAAPDQPSPLLDALQHRGNLPAGMRNNNPGNIKFTGTNAFTGVVGPSINTDQGDHQAVFATPEAGMAAMGKLLVRKFNGGKTTPDQLIAGNGGWTPGNHQAAANVARTMGITATTPLNLQDAGQLQSFMRALMLQEHGPASNLYPKELVAKGAALALGGGKPNVEGGSSGIGDAERPAAGTASDIPSTQTQITLNMAARGLQQALKPELDAGWADAKKAFEKGYMPDHDSLAALSENIAIVGDKQKSQELADWYDKVSKSGQMDRMTASQLEPKIASMQDAARTGGASEASLWLLKRSEDELKEREQLRSSDPVGLAERNGVVKPVGPIDWSNQQGTLEGQLRARSLTAAASADFAERDAVSIFKPAEKQAFSTFLTQAPADQVLGTLGAMAKTLPEDTLGATMRDVGGDKTARTYVAAAAMMQAGQVETAKAIVTGQRIIALNPDLVGQKFETAAYPVTPTVLPPELYAPALVDPASGQARAYTDAIDTAKAIYAAGKGPQGSKDYDDALWKQSVEKAVGGFVNKEVPQDLLTQRLTGAGSFDTGMARGPSFDRTVSGDGQKVIAPIPGMTQQQFSMRLGLLAASELRHVDNGLGATVTPAQFFDQSKFETIGAGQYLVRLGNGYVRDLRTGRSFVLDFNPKAPMNVGTVQ